MSDKFFVFSLLIPLLELLLIAFLRIMFNNTDISILKRKGISPQEVESQLISIQNGFPYLEIEAAATVGNGIITIDEDQCSAYIKTWDTYCSSGHRITKFVPASGAASRMFKDLFEFLDADCSVPKTDFLKKFFDKIQDFAFFDDLDKVCLKNEGRGVLDLIYMGSYKPVIENLLLAKGLNYGSLPKGLLKFHKYSKGARTPLEEHMAEGALYATGTDRNVHLHFTVSNEHLAMFTSLAESSKAAMSKRYGVTFDISFSEQKPSTDTIAADGLFQPFRDEKGNIVFRPGGHGALIENLNDIDSDIVFIKNIDNVVPDHIKADTVTNKKLIAGVLVSVENKIFDFLRLLDSRKYSRQQLLTMAVYLHKILNCKRDGIEEMDDLLLANFLYKKFNRPIRVCGMVQNSGEPGGGPFLTRNSDGTVSPQILESSQIDMNDENKKALFTQGSHFNPVDLVCSLRGYKDEKFNLTDYVDHSTGFISNKSKNGRELKALELPGLWNGAMSYWNTVFVEVPLSTFNPVKNVNDLLRKQHQPA